ncbi:unnamed protein product [Toxocara canis]|uniref:Uncharacterized protein n=1 Tax=Toxocara canis TaxID=6265 RepID=A0A183VFM9_TOXCA|nr:unnamed protein product [Toxocara canis]
MSSPGLPPKSSAVAVVSTSNIAAASATVATATVTTTTTACCCESPGPNPDSCYSGGSPIGGVQLTGFGPGDSQQQAMVVVVTVAAATVAEAAAISEVDTTATAELVDGSPATSSGSGYSGGSPIGGVQVTTIDGGNGQRDLDDERFDPQPLAEDPPKLPAGELLQPVPDDPPQPPADASDFASAMNRSSFIACDIQTFCNALLIMRGVRTRAENYAFCCVGKFAE